MNWEREVELGQQQRFWPLAMPTRTRTRASKWKKFSLVVGEQVEEKLEKEKFFLWSPVCDPTLVNTRN